MTIHTRKLPTFALYAAYADGFNVCSYGGCQDEALNNLADEIRQRQPVGLPARASATVGEGTGYERK